MGIAVWVGGTVGAASAVGGVWHPSRERVRMRGMRRWNFILLFAFIAEQVLEYRDGEDGGLQ